MRSAIAILLFFSVLQPLHAQQEHATYVDSVKEFLKYWLGTHKSIDSALILDKTPLNAIDTFLLGLRPSALDPNRKVYKRDQNASGSTQKAIDSIYISKKEMADILERLRYPNILKWTNEFLPHNRIIRKERVDSFFVAYHDFSSHHAEKYREYDAITKTYLWRHGYTRISPPAFLKKGKFAVLIYWNYYGRSYIDYSLTVHKNGKNGWEHFGCLTSGNVN